MSQKHTVLFTEKQIQERVRELAVEISRDFDGKEVILVGLLKGAAFFLVDLARAIEACGRVSACKIEFLGASSYKGRRKPGNVRVYLDLDKPLRKKNVIIVDDVGDTLRTLEKVQRHVLLNEPRTVRTCVLVEKPDKHCVYVHLDYIGFSKPKLDFLYGYGMDLKHLFRGLPFIAQAPSPAST